MSVSAMPAPGRPAPAGAGDPSPMEIDEALNQANALLYLMATALTYEIETSDSHRERGGSTAAGLVSLEATTRDRLARLLA